ncbi:MAG: sulfatase-like hydrolase/transferase, partial [Planctomycetota bacterium]
MRFYPISACLVLFHALVASTQLRAEALRPNVILIMADDVGYECFGCYGSRQYETPNIDRLARRGMRFNHCYSQPLCTPSRVKLMTGLSNARNYSAFSVLNRDQRTIGQYFQQAGYETAVAGKWQLLGAEHYPDRFQGKGTWPRDAGFGHACLWQVDRLGTRFWKPLLYVDGANREFGDDDYGPDVVTKYITDFMATHRDKPFFVYYPMILVHSPFV